MLSFKTLIVAVAVSLATAATKLQGANLNGKTKPGSLEACIGECDHDKDCKAGLKCFQRQNGEKIPGCVGKGSGKDWGYCYDPNPKPDSEIKITPKGGPTCADGENGGFSCPVGTSTLTGQMASTKCKASFRSLSLSSVSQDFVFLHMTPARSPVPIRLFFLSSPRTLVGERMHAHR